MNVPVTYTVRIHNEGPDGLWADVEELPGCFASGSDMDELRESLEEAISMFLSSAESECRVQIQDFGPAEMVEERHKVLVGG